MNKRSIYWFTHDLRLSDNLALSKAADLSHELACIYIIDPRWFKINRYQSKAIGNQRLRFLKQSLIDLDKQLEKHGQSLQLFHGNPESVLSVLINDYSITGIFRSTVADYELNGCWSRLKSRLPETEFLEYTTHTLFDKEALPFALNQLPATFTEFRKSSESLDVQKPLRQPESLPGLLQLPCLHHDPLVEIESDSDSTFQGGESAGYRQLQSYFANARPDRYFDTRNALQGWSNSTKLSPWLANGGLSARQVVHSLHEYETEHGDNKSTYWIFFELLWREYFQWYAHSYGARLFKPAGIRQCSPMNCFYPERFKKWCSGTTPWLIVNACMNELNATGYMSNRGRQIVASCFVNELGLDWRYGAAYFQQQLIDYDVASNWGNWQYLAGVGADARPKRHFNLEKQASQFDPRGEYINTWTDSSSVQILDSVDAADWPVS